MAKTRSSKPAASGEPAAAADSRPAYVLPAQTTNPPKLLVLPRAATPDAKVVTLPNPRYAKPTRYLACPDTGLYEFTKISAPKTTPRSWLIETPVIAEDDQSSAGRNTQVDGQIVKTADLYVATPIDPLFLLIPALAAPTPKSDAKRLFVSGDDHLDKLPEDASHLSAVLCMESIRKLFEARMDCVCDTVKVGDETLFRVNDEKLLGEVLHKARRMAEGALPASMEERFVRKALEAPILSQRRQQTISTESAGASTPGVATPGTESGESQVSTATTGSAASAESQASTAATSVPEDEALAEDTVKAAIQASEEVLSLQRVKVAFDFICASYIPPEITARLTPLLKENNPATLDFAPLDAYLAELAKLRADALAARSAGDYSRKHARDEEEDEAREEKKRKVEEEKKKKAMESRGVRELKKVDTKGMKKMSDFFKKK